MVRGCSSPVTNVPGTYQCAEMLRMAFGSGSIRPSFWKPRLHSLSSMAFIGDPWPTNRTGIRCMAYIQMPTPQGRFSARMSVPSGLQMGRMPGLPPRVFLLSPARAGGERMGLLLNPRAAFALASEFQQKGAAVGALFEFASGLYFRGKLAYARAFGRGPRGGSGGLAIVPGRGLMDVEQRITAEELRAIGEVPVDVRDARYREALVRDAELLASRLGKRGEAVLLGSIATGKYADLLLDILGDRLLFPPSFVGRGDMSRGGLLLRCVRAGMELPYAPLQGAIRHGPRPPKLPRY